MRILIVARTLMMLDGGGEKRNIHLVEGLRAHGHDVEILCGNPLFATPKHNRADLKPVVLRSPYTRNIVYRTSKIRGFWRLAGLLLAVDELVFSALVFLYMITHEAFDISYSYAVCYVPMFARLVPTPCLLVLPGLPNKLEQPFAKLASAIVADGVALARSREIFSLPVHEVKKGIDHTVFYPNAIPRDLDFRLNIITCARLETIKSLDILIQAVFHLHKKYSDLCLRICGEGTQLEYLQDLVRTFNLTNNVQFLGHLSQSEVASYLRISSIYVCSSRFENSPNSVLEAMACGLAIVGPLDSGIPFYVSTDGARLVTSRDPLDYAHAIDFFLSSESSRITARDSNLNSASSYRWNTYISEHTNIFNAYI